MVGKTILVRIIYETRGKERPRNRLMDNVIHWTLYSYSNIHNNCTDRKGWRYMMVNSQLLVHINLYI